MKKIKSSKIRLSKETITVLESPQLVAGGFSNGFQCISGQRLPQCNLTR